MAILCSVCVCRGTLGSVQSEMCSSVRVALWCYVAIRGAMWRYVVLCGDTGVIWRDVSAAVYPRLKMAIWRYVALTSRYVALRRATWRWVALCVPYVSITPLPEVSNPSSSHRVRCSLRLSRSYGVRVQVVELKTVPRYHAHATPVGLN